MASRVLGRVKCRDSVSELNNNLKRIGSRHRIRATIQSPRIQIRALDRFEDGSEIRTSALLIEKEGDLEKAFKLCIEMDEADAPLTLLGVEDETLPGFTAWSALGLTLQTYLDKKGTKWRGQAYDTHIRQLNAFTGKVTAQKLMDWVEASNPKSADRVRRIGTLKKLMICAGIDIPNRWMERIKDETKFSIVTKAVNPRTLPTDAQIEAFVDSIPNRAWQCAFGFMAVYGLRPHEVFCISEEIDEQGLIEINSMKVCLGKEGWRYVQPRRLDWIKRWNLRNATLPRFNFKHEAKALGKRVTQQFARYRDQELAPHWRVNQRTYDIRHAYAAALHTEAKFKKKVSIDQAADWMGHSTKVHKDTYLRWLSKSSAKDAAHRLAEELA